MAPEDHFNRGFELMQAGRLTEAIDAYRAALALRPDYPQAWNNLGHAYLQQRNADDAIACFTRALAFRPQHAETQYGLARAFRLAGRKTEAAELLRRCLMERADFPPALDELSSLLAEDGHIGEAIALLRRLCQAQPSLAEPHNRLGALLADIEIDSAIAEFREAIALRPDLAEAHSNLGLALTLARRFDDAEAAHRTAMQIAPAYVEARWNLALLQLQRGNYAEGFRDYEARRQLLPRVIHRSFPEPEWDGSDLRGRRILLHSEQGFGDTIQFVRYAPLLARRGAKVILSCQPPLRRLLRTVEGIEQVIVTNEAPPPFDVHCPLGSLPLREGTTLATIPNRVPYISADPARVDFWRQRLAREPGERKIGIAWTGNPAHAANRRRSIDLRELAPVAEIAGVRLVSLHKSPSKGTALGAPFLLIDWTDELHDFADTAALASALDLVLSVDTAVAHLAGALALPARLLLSPAGEWRYLFDRQDSPWYPTMRIFRCQTIGDWKPVVSQIARELRGAPR